MLKGTLKLTKEDKEWAKEVKVRDGWKCVVCDSETKPNAHHIIPREVLETKYLIMNGITLCPKHHFFSRQISAHNNPLALFIWMEINRNEQLGLIKMKMNEVLLNASD